MKVRWMHNCLRLRVTPREFGTLLKGEQIVETATFPGGWSVKLGGDESALRSDSPGKMGLTLSAASLAELARPEAEGVYFSMDRFKGFFAQRTQKV